MPLLFRIRIVSLFIIITGFAICVFSPAYADESDFDTPAEFAYMIDYNTGEVLFEKNADAEMEPSSMTKIMTGYLLFDALKRGSITMETTFPVSVKAWQKGGSKMYVKEGDRVSVDDLLHGILIQSGNDACIVAAEGLSGSEEAFAEDMNFMAKKLGMTNTHFKNATGWPDEEHLTTAHDLVTLTRHTIDDFPEYYYFYSTREFTYSKIKQYNRNKLLGMNLGADGLKTGYTDRAGYGIVASAIEDGRRIILAINGLKSSKARINEAERLLRHGFRDFRNLTLFNKGDVIEKAEVWFGNSAEIPLVTDRNIEFTIAKRPSQRGGVEIYVSYEGPIPAPIKKGSHIADLVVKKDGKIDETIPLYAANDVAEISFFGRALRRLKHYLLGTL